MLAVERIPTPQLAYRPVRSLAMIAMHSNPLEEPGTGDAGGMTVYVRQVARELARQGVDVDIFTRRSSSSGGSVTELFPSVRVIQIDAGAPDLAKEDLPSHLPEFAWNVAAWIEDHGVTYDVMHSHYWLSGRAASIVSSRLATPFVHTFHTLGRVKNSRLAPLEIAEPEGRLDGEAKVIFEADAIVASTVEEREWLVDLYSAHPERIHLVAPGVDHELFRPGDKAEARRGLGLTGKKVLLFVGRLQPLKAPDTAIRALAQLIQWGRLLRDEVRLVIVGGPSGASGATEPDRLWRIAKEFGIAGQVQFVPAQPQVRLPRFYQAADVVLVPSHSESFGLAALEAQACGVPVVGSAIGGLKTIVRHGQTGYLVEPTSVSAFAERTWRILSDASLARSMGSLAACSSSEFSWQRCAQELLELYLDSALSRSQIS